MKAEQLKELVNRALEELKAKDIVNLDVRELTDVTDFMVIATGTSNRHVKSLADNVSVEAKKQQMPPLSMEGENGAEWMLVDFGDVIVHIMLPDTRDFYDLEHLWSQPAEQGDDA